MACALSTKIRGGDQNDPSVMMLALSALIHGFLVLLFFL
jgi:hypothetical protein